MIWPPATPQPACVCDHKRIAHFASAKEALTIPCSLCPCRDYEAAT